jgi:integrase
MSLPATVMAELEDHLSRFAGQTYVFPWDDGGPLRAEEWRRRFWRPAVTRAGLAPLRAHDLKHTGVALLAAAGAGAAEIARRAGHTDPGFTLRTYGHLLPGVDRLAAERLDALRSSVVDSTLVARQWHAELDRHPGLPVGGALT